MESFFVIVLLLIILGAVLYAIFRSKTGTSPGRDAYYYIISFMALALLYWAVADLFRVILEKSWASSTYYNSYNSYNTTVILRKMSLRLSTIVVGIPVFGFHWFKAGMKSKNEMDWHSRRSYSMAVLFVTTLIVLGCGTGLVYQGFNFLLGVGNNAGLTLAFFLPYTLAAGGLWWVHYRIWHEASSEMKTA